MFAGNQETTITLLCPRTRKQYSGQIVIGSNERFIKIADPFAQTEPDAADEPDAEYEAWAAASRRTALDYSRSMLTASSAAIPVYFAVLDYLGQANGFAAIPGVLFLIAAAAFAIAQRPRLQATSRTTFAETRARALRRINGLATSGTALFLLATAGSVATFAATLW
ncbi:hypothetical protein [Actinophytocola sp.]|uniref:hypothetical protein n=1 Tax=Actinophytocola sp. TaxID=1872138 RepID=UPI003D6B9D15